MGGGRRAQLRGEPELAVVVQIVLLAEEDHLVFEQGGVDLWDGRRIQIRAEVDALDARADVGAELDHPKCWTTVNSPAIRWRYPLLSTSV